MIRDFFATMTHDLKTPLSQVRLQGDVIAEVVEKGGVDDKRRLKELSFRLIEDTQNLENQLDKIIQLARVERGDKLSCQSVDLFSFIRDCHKKWMGKRLELTLESFDTNNSSVYADEFALEIIFRNLFENTFLHGSRHHVRISMTEDRGTTTLHYNDGHNFTGEWDKIGMLFYKHASKGSGIGLYLVKKLMQKMNGCLKIANHQGLLFSLTFTSAKENTQP